MLRVKNIQLSDVKEDGNMCLDFDLEDSSHYTWLNLQEIITLRNYLTEQIVIAETKQP